MQWYLLALKKYAEFSGRAHRTEYWMFFLINFLIGIAIGFLDGALGTQILGLIYALALLIPGLAAAVRRLHDTGRSGWWVLIVLIPVLGAIVLIVLLAMPTQGGANEYGPEPARAPA